MSQDGRENARLSNIAARDCIERGDYEGALENFLRALKSLPPDHLQARAAVYNNRGHAQVRFKKYDDALSSFRKAVTILRELRDSIGLGEQLGNVGSVYRDMEDWEEALKNYFESLSVFRDAGHKNGIANQYSNIAYAHVRQGEIQKGFEFFEKAKGLYDELGNESKARLCEQNIQALRPYLGRYGAVP